VESPESIDGDIEYDIVKYADTYEALLMVGGDDKFADILERLGRAGKMINVWAPSVEGTQELRDICADYGNYRCLDDIRSDIDLI
jgi:hypothetical protein